MNKKIIFPLCLLLVVVWTAGCTCPGPRARHPRPSWWPRRRLPPGRGPRMPAAMPDAGAFEEAEGTCHLLGRRQDIVGRNPG